MMVDVNVASRACGAPALDPTQEKEEGITQPKGSGQFYRKELTRLIVMFGAL